MTIRAALPLAILLLAGCARSEEAKFTSTGNDTALPEANVHHPDGEEDELTLGEWRAGLQDEQPVLEFGPAGAPALFSLRCDARRGTLLQRHDSALSGDLPVMLISVGSETKRLAVAAAAGTTPMMRATLPVNDPFRAVLTAATQPIVVRIGDAAPLVLPPSPLVGAYTAACANGENQRVDRGSATSNQAATANAAAPATD